MKALKLVMFIMMVAIYSFVNCESNHASNDLVFEGNVERVEKL